MVDQKLIDERDKAQAEARKVPDYKDWDSIPYSDQIKLMKATVAMEAVLEQSSAELVEENKKLRALTFVLIVLTAVLIVFTCLLVIRGV